MEQTAWFVRQSCHFIMEEKPACPTVMTEQTSCQTVITEQTARSVRLLRQKRQPALSDCYNGADSLPSQTVVTEQTACPLRLLLRSRQPALSVCYCGVDSLARQTLIKEKTACPVTVITEEKPALSDCNYGTDGLPVCFFLAMKSSQSPTVSLSRPTCYISIYNLKKEMNVSLNVNYCMPEAGLFLSSCPTGSNEDGELALCLSSCTFFVCSSVQQLKV
jgi:hypothetical protein